MKSSNSMMELWGLSSGQIEMLSPRRGGRQEQFIEGWKMRSEESAWRDQAMNVQTTFMNRQDIADVLRDIEKIEGLSEWADSDDLPVQKATVRLAKAVIADTCRECYAKGIKWKKPKVSPNSNGTVHLFWREGKGTLVLNVSANPERLSTIVRSTGHDPLLQIIPVKQAWTVITDFLK